MTTRATLLAAVLALVAAVGCGDQDGPPSSRQTPITDDAASAGGDSTAPAPELAEEVEAEDKRSVALACLRDEKGFDARPVGDKSIQIGREGVDPRIDFFQSSLEAEAFQVEGEGEGAEQIGAALLYVRDASEEDLIEMEDCLNEQ